MLHGKRIVVMPAYHVGKKQVACRAAVHHDDADRVLVGEDSSTDATVRLTLVQALTFDQRISEVCRPTEYFTEASEVNFRHSMTQAFGSLWTNLRSRLQRLSSPQPTPFSEDLALRSLALALNAQPVTS